MPLQAFAYYFKTVSRYNNDCKVNDNRFKTYTQRHKKKHESSLLKGPAYLHLHTFYEQSDLASFERNTNDLYVKLNCKNSLSH